MRIRLGNAARRLLPNNRFARSVSVLAGGTAVGQVIVIAVSPVLTRLYSPEDFGVLAVYSSLLAILGVVASLRYQLAIPLPETEDEAMSVVALSFLVVLGMTAISVVMVILFGVEIIQALNTPALEPYLWLLPVGLLLIGVYQVFNYWAIRMKSFRAISRTKVTQSAGMAVVQVGGYALGPLALLLGRIVGQATGTLSLWSEGKKKSGLSFRNVSPRAIGKTAVRYRNFPAYSSWAGLLNTSGAQVPPMFFAAFFGPAAAGSYMLAQRVINVPMTVVAVAVADAFLPSSVEAKRENRLGNEVQTLFRVLAVMIFPPAAVLLVAAPDLFSVAFGKEWRQAGEMVRWLTPMLAVQFLVSPLSRIFVTLERQRLGLTLQTLLFFLRSGSLVIAYWLSFSVVDAVKLFSALSIMGYFGYFLTISSVSDVSIKAVFFDLLNPLFSIFIVVIAFSSSTLLFESKNIHIGLFVILSFVIILTYWRFELKRDINRGL